jgi:hypothetical protein
MIPFRGDNTYITPVEVEGLYGIFHSAPDLRGNPTRLFDAPLADNLPIPNYYAGASPLQTWNRVLDTKTGTCMLVLNIIVNGKSLPW